MCRTVNIKSGSTIPVEKVVLTQCIIEKNTLARSRASSVIQNYTIADIHETKK